MFKDFFQHEQDISQSIDRFAQKSIRCKCCSQPITTFEQRIQIAGSHIHHKTNPAEINFCFGCFVDANGCTREYSYTKEHSWFPSYSWCLAICSSCGTHLGWHWQTSDEINSFFGLIIEKLSFPSNHPSNIP